MQLTGLSGSVASTAVSEADLEELIAMPYDKLSDLPDSVRSNLPHHAQEIYRAAFNSAYAEYDKPSERRGNETREETAHKVAWSAVKKEYHKNVQGDWVSNSD